VNPKLLAWIGFLEHLPFFPHNVAIFQNPEAAFFSLSKLMEVAVSWQT
jgi:hypothetical protein